MAERQQSPTLRGQCNEITGVDRDPQGLSLELHLTGESVGVLDTVIGCGFGHDIALLPFAQGSAHVLARNAGHGGEVTLTKLMPEQDLAAAMLLTHAFSQAEQSPRATRPLTERNVAATKA